MEGISTKKHVELDLVQINEESFYKISNNDRMRPFFMSIVSDANHWLFISSNGGLTAGRKNAAYALFPYYTDDKITESIEITGSKSIFQIHKSDGIHIWEPFSNRFEGKYDISRNLYKNTRGNKVLFEEINHDLDLTFRYQWNTSNQFGFVRMAQLINTSDLSVKLSLLDGIQNIIPHGVHNDLQNGLSNLVDAYKRSELEKSSGLGIYALSAIIVDRAEPSEALKANVAWSLGLDNPTHLVSSIQVKNFRKKQSVKEEVDVKGEKGAYLLNADIDLAPRSTKEWMIIADVNKNHSAIAQLITTIKADQQLEQTIRKDIEAGTQKLVALNGAADGLQLTSDHFRDTRHFSNTLFNIMRGGIFDDNYQIEKEDFSIYLSKANKKVYKNVASTIQGLPDIFTLAQLRAAAEDQEDTNFKRLCFEYLPLKFSRRHGDPSRPWNKFSINTQNEIDGSKILDYQGNWRDIFQNWEALAHAYPAFIDNMIHKFLNASTFDGYNPYRVTKDGFDWEAIEPHDPWSYIGYWGDHQIIYLLKFLEFIEKHQPGQLAAYFDQDIFVYANVPYKIKSYEDILKNNKDTIEFDYELDQKIREHRKAIGADGALLTNPNGAVYQVNFIEKIIATALAKMSNLIPEGGIWMNTQRPEWNDANNALVGNGVSVVTLYYLRRFMGFFDGQFANKQEGIEISSELVEFFKGMVAALDKHQGLLASSINDVDRKRVMDDLGQASNNYRQQIYQQGFKGTKNAVSFKELQNFVQLSLKYIDHTIAANKRKDNLYHAYNLMTLENESAVSVSYLSEMLEGQVAVLSAGYLSSEEVLEVLDAMKQSALYRKDQFSYILYPNKRLPGFLEKNNIPMEAVNKSVLLTQLVKDGNADIIEKDLNGGYHFNGNFKNANDLKVALDTLAATPYQQLAKEENSKILQIFEEVFNHKAFTGRSGTFYGYEGLGSIYWHMVSKLALAAQECCWKAIAAGESETLIRKLADHYYEINEGIGVHKSPTVYGAFPTDPYSHTPGGKGAQQPGMTGQVKEDILCRFGELGVLVKDGLLHFQPNLLHKDEFLKEPTTFHYIDLKDNKRELPLESNSLAFTYCQVPIVYILAEEPSIEVIKGDQKTVLKSSYLDANSSQQIFARTGEIDRIRVRISI